MATRKEQALARITKAAKAAKAAEQQAAKAQEVRDRAILSARLVTDPASYQEIADAAGITKDRVSQILGRQRSGD